MERPGYETERERESERDENDRKRGKESESQREGLTACWVRQKELERGKLCYFSEDLSEVAHTKASGTTSLQPA